MTTVEPASTEPDNTRRVSSVVSPDVSEPVTLPTSSIAAMKRTIGGVTSGVTAWVSLGVLLALTVTGISSTSSVCSGLDTCVAAGLRPTVLMPVISTRFTSVTAFAADTSGDEVVVSALTERVLFVLVSTPVGTVSTVGSTSSTSLVVSVRILSRLLCSAFRSPVPRHKFKVVVFKAASKSD